MADTDLDLLLGRLAVHYKILDKARVSEALKLWRSVSASTGQSFPDFLLSESYVAPDVLPKLLKARDQYLAKSGAPSAPAAPAPPAPAAAPVSPAPPAPPASIGAETVRMQVPQDLLASPAAPLAAPVSEDFPAPVSEELPIAVPAPALGVAAPDPLPAVSAPATPVQAAPVEVVPVPAQEEPSEAASAQAEAQTQATPSGAELDGGAEMFLRLQADTTLEDLLRYTRKVEASDLHVHSAAPLKLRLNGALQDVSDPVPREDAERLIFGLLSEEQGAQLREKLQIDFSYSIPGVGRFRANAYYQHRGLDAVFRAVPPDPPTLEELGLPEALKRFADYHQGIVLFTGPAGCGKSSTMAAIVEMINRDRPDHILTIEEPIEYVYTPAECVVNQREVGPHTESFARALRGALREDPDIIVIGELRDLETISLALTAAETGHVVLGTLHTSNAIRTVNRVLGVFPPEEQAQIATMFSESLRAICSQRLVPRADGTGRVPALEVLINNKAIGNLIRERRTFQIKSVLQTGGPQGMYLLDASLAKLVKAGVITKEAAFLEADDPTKFA